LLHISDGESSERGIFREDFTTHGLGGVEFNHTGISGLDGLGVFFKNLSVSSIDLGLDTGELASDVSGVAIEDGGISRGDLSRVVKNNNLGKESNNFLRGIVLGISTNVSSLDVLNGNSLNVESNVVSGDSLGEGFVMHFDGLDVGSNVRGGEGNVHTGLDDSGFDSSDRDGSNTSDLIDVLEGKSEGLVDGSLGGDDVIKSLDESLTLVPGEVVRLLKHVISVPSGNGDEGDLSDGVSDLLKISRNFLSDFVISVFRVSDGIHLVTADDHLLNSESVRKESVFSGLSILGNSGFEFSGSGSDHKNGTISLGGSGNHILNEISMSGGIDDGEVVLGGFEFPEGDIDGNTSFSLSLELVKNPSVFERSLSHVFGFLLELFDGSLINTSTLVDKMSGGSGLSGVDVTNNDE